MAKNTLNSSGIFSYQNCYYFKFYKSFYYFKKFLVIEEVYFLLLKNFVFCSIVGDHLISVFCCKL